jgi:beta-glucanase (GH16 family)
MSQIIKCLTLLSIFLVNDFCFAQPDVVYDNLVWSDEFNTTGSNPVNSDNWFHQTQLPTGENWHNGEVQHYTDRIENAFVENGYLNIVAIKEDFSDQGHTKLYTSARLNSKFAFTYGRIDVRAKLPIEAGTWPAIWMLAKNTNEVGGYWKSGFGTIGWPACGEIDIMEHGIFPTKPVNFVQSAIHTTSSSGNTINKGGIIASDLENDFHVYSLIWSPNQLTFLLDNVIYYIYNPAVKDAKTWPFDSDQYILLNVAMGGNAGTIDPSFIQSSIKIDYVRVYQTEQ